MNRYSCGSLAVNKWLEQRICLPTLDSYTQRLLRENHVPFRYTYQSIKYS
jgi:hypothetical protein